MRKLILVFAVLFHVSPAQAFFAPEIEHCVYSDGGQWFENIGSTYCGTSFMQGSNIAHEFNVYDNLNIGSIESLMVWNEQYFDRVSTIGANMVIYEGSRDSEHFGRMPSDKRIFEKRFSFDEILTEQESIGYINSPFPMEWHGVNNINLTLKPGNYWMAVEDGTQYLFVSGGPRLGTVTTPEPTTMLLLGSGLLGALVRRRRKA